MKILVIGTGKVARDNYLPVLSRQGDVELHLYNRNVSKARECAVVSGGTVHETFASAMSAEPDAVFVLTNETTRADVLRALVPYHPQRVFSEKPLVAAEGQDHVTETDFKEARACLNALEKEGCRTAMIFNYRFFEQTERARRIAADRKWGAPVSTTAMVNYACWSHVLDLMHYFLGPVRQVSAVRGSKEHRHGKSGAADLTATLAFANGASGTILGTWAMNFSYPLFDLQVNYEKGRFRLRGLDDDLEVFDYAGSTGETYGINRNTSRWDWYKASFEKSVSAYLESIRSGDPPPVPGEWGLRELQVEAAFQRSISLKRPVDLDSELPLGEVQNA